MKRPSKFSLPSEDFEAEKKLESHEVKFWLRFGISFACFIIAFFVYIVLWILFFKDGGTA
jgi:hypothetical protein